MYAGDKLLGTATHSTKYEAPYSIAELTISKDTVSTQLTEKNEILTIKALADSSANQVGWTNGSFLIKLPTDIITADINNAEIITAPINFILRNIPVLNMDFLLFLTLNT